MNTRAVLTIALALLSTSAGRSFAEDTPVNSSVTVQWMIERARAWAEEACGAKSILSDILAEDFRGTSAGGKRYEKPTGEPTYGPDTHWSKDCRLDDANVRFFGPDVAVMYGAESRTDTLADGKLERRCLVWTDTWLQRKGRWQIVAVQDNRVACPAK